MGGRSQLTTQFHHDPPFPTAKKLTARTLLELYRCWEADTTIGFDPNSPFRCIRCKQLGLQRLGLFVEFASCRKDTLLVYTHDV